MLAENLADNASSPIQKALPLRPQEGAIVTDEEETNPSEQALSLDTSTPLEALSQGGPDVGDDDFDMEKEVDEVSVLNNTSGRTHLSSIFCTRSSGLSV
jgi:hypothetical protein